MSNKTYIIKPTKNEKIIGNNYPSVRTHLSSYSFGENLLHKLSSDKLLDIDFNINFSLANGSMLCDLMSQSSIPAFGLLVSKKLASILDKFNLGEGKHRFYKVKIFSLKTSYDYFWLQFVWTNRDDIVNYEKTFFFIREKNNELLELDIFSRKDYLRIKEELGYLKTIFFNNLELKTHPKMDLFLMPFRGHIIASQKFKNAIDESSIIGIDFTPSEIN